MHILLNNILIINKLNSIYLLELAIPYTNFVSFTILKTDPSTPS